MTGAWEVYVPQASIRYEFEKGSKWRVEAGKFTSPIGLGMTENRASVNDGVIWWHRGYYSYLPTIGGGAAPHALISSIYPMGIQANTSAKHWDARVAFIDRAPADFFHTEDPPFRANGVVGGGVSPLPGNAHRCRGRVGPIGRRERQRPVHADQRGRRVRVWLHEDQR